MMRRAKSYSIIDHQLLHGGYFNRISHESMILYLFLALVGDRSGRSFYADVTVRGILRLEGQALPEARLELIREGLIDYRPPYWRVKTIKLEGEQWRL